jgi:hypothetical protein
VRSNNERKQAGIQLLEAKVIERTLGQFLLFPSLNRSKLSLGAYREHGKRKYDEEKKKALELVFLLVL